MKNQKGYTVIELLMVIWFFVIIAALGGIGYLAWPFISKFW